MSTLKRKNEELELAYNDPYLLGKWSGFNDLTELHNGWIKSFVFGKGDQTLLAHRGSFKTTCLSIAIALMIILFPLLNIILFRKTDSDVIEVITQTQKLLKNDYFQKLAYKIYGKELVLTKESSYEIDTNFNKSPSGASQLLGLGIKASMTGKHGDIIITDDIVTIVDRISQAERERTKLAYQEIQNIKNRGGRIINTGTPWHKDDAFTLMANITRHDCYNTGLINDKELQSLRDVMTSSLFAANYELKHIADGDALFSTSRIDDGENTHLIYDGVCHIDASYGGKDGTAFTILKEQPDGTIYVYGELKQQHIDNCLAGFEAKREHYRAGILYNESNADKGYLNKKIKHPSKTYHEKMNKYIKISTHLKGRWNDVIFIKDTDKDYINQILDYTENSSHDDAPDSLASLIREATNKAGIFIGRA